MSITKTPLLSLGARGSIGNTLTLQKRGASTLIRTKPTPAYRRTLLQVYQRWLYEDYAYLWRQQSQATKQEYATDGSKRHLTGFQCWMRYHLLNLPDIIGWWKLDEKTGAVAHDSSRNLHNGTIVGATPATGIIAGGYTFDGLNDLIRIVGIPPPALTEMTALIFANIGAFTGALRHSFDWGVGAAPFGARHFALHNGNTNYVYLKNTAGVLKAPSHPFTPGIAFLGGFVWDGTTVCIIHDKIITPGIAIGGVVSPDSTLLIGTSIPGAEIDWYDGLADNLIIFNRALDATEVLRWAERRYPA